MTSEIPAHLEEIIKQVDKIKQLDTWLYYRFDENYTVRFADGLKQEVSASLSLELKDKDRQNISNQYGKTEMSEVFKSYFAKQYVIALQLLDIIQGDTDKQGDDDQRVLENAIIAASKVAGFVASSSQTPHLDQEAIERSFTATYSNPEEFSSAYLAMVELVIYEATRRKTQPTEERKVVRMLVELQDAIQEIEKYVQLLAGETLRTQKAFMPTVIHQVVGDLYTR